MTKYNLLVFKDFWLNPLISKLVCLNLNVSSTALLHGGLNAKVSTEKAARLRDFIFSAPPASLDNSENTRILMSLCFNTDQDKNQCRILFNLSLHGNEF